MSEETEAYEGVVENYSIDVDTTGAVQMGPVNAGEFKLLVIKAEMAGGTSEKGNEWKALKILLDIPDEISADYVNHMEFLPNPKADAKQLERQKGNFQKFKHAFGFADNESFTAQDLVGREVWAYLIQDEYNGVIRNKVRTWIWSQG